MNIYELESDLYTNAEWYALLSFVSGYPKFDEMFTPQGEIKEEYQDTFEMDIFRISHDNVRISDHRAAVKFIHYTDEIPVTMKIAMIEAITDAVNSNSPMQLGESSDETGFVLDVWHSQKDIDTGEDPCAMYQFWFEEYE